MTPPDSERQDILARIDVLLEEAYALPRSSKSWEHRLYIDWELFQLFRRLASLIVGDNVLPTNSFTVPLENHPRRLRRHDRPARFLP